MSAGVSAEDVAREGLIALYGQNAETIKQYVAILATRGIEWGLLGPREGDKLWSRHIANAGQGDGGGTTQVIATFDPADVVIRALGDTNVRKRLFAVFGQNKAQINRNLGRG